MMFGSLVAHPLQVGHRLGCHVLCVLERTGCRGVSEPNGAVHVGEKVTNALFGQSNAVCGTVRWSLRIPSRCRQTGKFQGKELEGT